MKKNAFLAAGVLGLCIGLDALEITSQFPVVSVNPKGSPERYAPQVMQEHLQKIFGGKVTILPENQWKKGTPAIVLKPDPKLGNEEWSIRSDGKVLTISGGWSRGVYYGVCEFLEKFGGVRWYTPEDVKIPRKKSIFVPDNKEFRRKPFFSLGRNSGAGLESRTYQRSRSYLKLTWPSPLGEWPTLFSSRGIGGGHTFWKLTKDLKKDQEYMLPVDEQGNRTKGVSGLGPGQICFSNPDFRKWSKLQVAKWIAEAEKAKDKYGFRGDWMQWIDISQNDNVSNCRCKGCQALEKKYGNTAGAQLEFINDIASAFPDRMFQTFAYIYTSEPPKNIKARDNVMIYFAYLGTREYYFDLLRPLNHPNNAKLLQMYNGWRNLTKHKAIWGYHRLYNMTEAFPWPQCCFWNIGDNIRFYRDFGADKVYIESEYAYQGIMGSRAFHYLHNYLESKLLDDPYLDDKAIVEEYFAFVYGSVAPEMKEYAAYLRKRIDAVPGMLTTIPLKKRGILDAEFFRTVNGIFARAEKKAKGNQKLLGKIRIERFPVDYAALEMWDQGGKASGVSRDVLCDRLEKELKYCFSCFYPESWRRPGGGQSYAEKLKQALMVLHALRHPLPVPPEFANEEVIQLDMLNNNGNEKFNVKDPEAAYGQAVKLGKLPEDRKRFDHPNQPMEFGIYDYTTKRYILKKVITGKDLPKDEKYHLYYIGRHAPDGFHKEYLWGHRSWSLRIGAPYKRLWNPTDLNREYDLYVSCKMTGPAYVKGSKSENAVYVDKIVAVKRGIRAKAK